MTYLEGEPGPHEGAGECLVRHVCVHPRNRLACVAGVEAGGGASKRREHVVHVRRLRRPVLLRLLLREILPAVTTPCRVSMTSVDRRLMLLRHQHQVYHMGNSNVLGLCLVATNVCH